ncbi:MAG TPA: hypothetical protein VHY22_18525, partial [Chthoniobacteraceae bacterium]|nr:hypothetical protein [Chthoniobacteraceae bacterium]
MKTANPLLKPILRVLLIATLATALPVLAKTPVYEIIDLGTLGGDAGSASAINESGQVVGASYTGSDNTSEHATLFSGTGKNNTDLGTLGGLASIATGISSDGRIVGMAENSDNSACPALYGSGGSNNIDLGLLPGGGGHIDEEVFASVSGVNADGKIVGSSPTSGAFEVHAALFSGSGSNNIDLGTLPGGANMTSDAYAINDSGEIVGESFTTGGTTIYGIEHAAMFDGAGDVADLGTLFPGGSAYATAISNSGAYIVGQGVNPVDGRGYAALFSLGADGNINLGTLGGSSSIAYGVNDSGQVVGWSNYSTTDVYLAHAFLYTAAGGMADLNAMVDPTSGYTITGAVGINNLGQIAANGTDRNGNGRALLLIPRGVSPEHYTAVIPPPSDTSLPQGYGEFTMTTTSAGKAMLAGRLGDGTAFGVTTKFTGGMITLNQKLYNKKGSLAGTITFETTGDTDADGQLTWIKPETTKGRYQGGFTVSVDFQGAIFTAPALSTGTCSITFAAGGLVSAITHTLTISTNDHVTVNDPGADKLKMTVSKAEGTFTGTFLIPGEKKVTH